MNIIEAAKLIMREGKWMRRRSWAPQEAIFLDARYSNEYRPYGLHGKRHPMGYTGARGPTHDWALQIDDLLAEDWEEATP